MSIVVLTRARAAIAPLIAACGRRGIDGPTLAAVVAGVLVGATAAPVVGDTPSDAAATGFSTRAAECAARPAETKESAE
jgi:hypothetical protein